MKTSDYLRRCLALINDPAHWTKRVTARNRLGLQVSALSDAATCWCSMGAMLKVSEEFNFDTPQDAAYDYLVKGFDTEELDAVSIFNDSHTHSEVIAGWHKAIQLAERDENL